MISDSIAVNSCDFTCRITKNEKVFIKNNIIFGCVGSVRVSQVIMNDLVIPEQLPTTSDLSYLCIDLIAAIHGCLDKTIVNTEEVGDSDILIGYKGKIYRLEGCTQLLEIVSNYDAIGCGSETAVGALYAIESYLKDDLTIKEKLELAIDSVSNFSVGLKKPYKILSTE
jgi:hypothetical protein